MYSQFIDNVKSMAKDKLITVRIKQELYDSFKVWTESRNSNISDTLRGFIVDCLNGTARQNIVIADSGNNEDTIKKLEASLYEKLYTQLYNDLSSQFIASDIDDSLSSQNIDTDIDNELSSQCIDGIDNELVGIEKTEDNLVAAILDNIHNEETTEDSTPSECPNLPSSEELGDKVPDTEEKPVNEEKPEKDKKISNAEKFLGYLGTITSETKITSKQWLEEELGIGKGFFSRGNGKKLWEEYIAFNTTEKFFFKKQSV